MTILPEAKLDALLNRHAMVEAELARQLAPDAFVKLSRELAEITPAVDRIKAYRAVGAEPGADSAPGQLPNARAQLPVALTIEHCDALPDLSARDVRETEPFPAVLQRTMQTDRSGQLARRSLPYLDVSRQSKKR